MADSYSILLIEDDPDDAWFSKRAFGAACAEVAITVVRDGNEAISTLATGPRPDHVVLDLKLPSRSGLEILGWIRAHPTLHDLPVTILSGSNLDADVEEARRLGIHAYVQKSVGYAAFAQAVRTLCDGLGLRRAAS